MLARVGELVPLRGGVIEISRLVPSLTDGDGRDTGPIDDPFVSRQPISLRRLDGAFEVASSSAGVVIDGAELPAGSSVRVPASDLTRGVPIVLADRVAL